MEAVASRDSAHKSRLVITANANWTLFLFDLSKLGKTPEKP
jgi:hypothetical protein